MTQPFDPKPLRARLRLLALAISTIGAVPAATAVDTYSIAGSVISAGGSDRRTSTCFKLSATSGQAVFGGPDTNSGTGGVDYTLFAGFWRAHPPAQESVFSSGFENCGS